jgi:hypothetical protein
LEVAEHLPESSAGFLLDSLCKHSDIIVFSAAIPGQGGQNHVNEQPFTYWQSMFAERGFQWHDVFRNRYWEEPTVEWWYKQNMFLIAKAGISIPKQLLEPDHANAQVYVHPELWLQQKRKLQDELQLLKEKEHSFFNGHFSFNTYIKILWQKLIRIVRKRIGLTPKPH